MTEFLQRLKERKLVQWAVAYVAAAFALLQGIDIIAQQFGWPEGVRRGITLAMVVGFFVTLVLAWYHGERGAQRVTGTELLILALLLSLGGGLLWRYASTSRAPVASVPVSAVTAVSPAPAAEIPAKSIAVLPFENLSAEKENAYFVEGIQDEILTRLAKISALKVISRTSTMRYASRPDNLREIAQQLGVAHIMEGSVQRAGGAVRVNVQLIEARSDSHLWAESYDGEIKDIFSVESKVAQSVADALRAKLLPEEAVRIANVPTKNPEAYDSFLKAEYFSNQFYSASAKDPADSVQRAASLYESAVAADPDFALAYARLGYLKARIYWYNIDPSARVIEAAQRAAERALALQPELGEAHLTMGFVHYWGHRDYEAALLEFTKARQSLPNNPHTFAAIAYVHRRQARMEEALPELERAAALDPRDNQWPREIGSTFVYMRRYSEATPAYERALALVPEDFETQVNRASALQLSGDLAGASKALEAIPQGIDPQGTVSITRWQLAIALRQPDQALAVLEHAPAWVLDTWPSTREPVTLLRAQALLQNGETGPARTAFLQAQQALQSLLGNPRVEPAAQACLALVYAGLGEKKAALEAGRRAAEGLPVSRDVMVGGSYLTQLAMVEAQVGEQDSAINHIEQILEIPAGHALSSASLRTDPVWDPLRNDPRFKALLTKYGAGEQRAR
ncbi:MAG: tetratricopeptide repeat protein [Chthoniobacterales bacterium]